MKHGMIFVLCRLLTSSVICFPPKLRSNINLLLYCFPVLLRFLMACISTWCNPRPPNVKGGYVLKCAVAFPTVWECCHGHADGMTDELLAEYKPERGAAVPEYMW